MKRRDFVLALGALAMPPVALAQASQARIGVLAPLQRPGALPWIVKRLGELGFVEGKNLSVVLRSTNGVAEKCAPLARELVDGKPDLLIAYGSEPEARALIQSTGVVPIVVLALDYDPVQAGIVSSFQRPGKNVTGMFIPTLELTAKRLELMREILPRLTRLLVLSDSYSKDQLKVISAAAERMRVQIVEITFATPPYDFESAFNNGRKAGVDALLLPLSPVFFEQQRAIAELALANRLPSVVPIASMVRSGFLAAYGIDSVRGFARAGDIAARILKGARPGEIPMEQANIYQFGVNLTVAKTLGLTIPPQVRLRADVVVE